jgi:hypothetical protein
VFMLMRCVREHAGRDQAQKQPYGREKTWHAHDLTFPLTTYRCVRQWTEDCSLAEPWSTGARAGRQSPSTSRSTRSRCASTCSRNTIYDPDGGGEGDADGRLQGAGPQLVAAHLALDPARHLPATAALDALLQDLGQHRLVQGTPRPRGGRP